MNDSLGSKLSKVLASPELEERAVDKLADHIAELVIVAAFDIEGLSKKEIKELKDALHHVAHWAVHIGQSVWQLKNIRSVSPLKASTESDLYVTVLEIYIRVFSMLGSDDMYVKLINSSATRPDPLHANKQELRHLNHDASFTRLRLASWQDKAISAEGTQLGIETPSVLDEVIASLHKSAELYIQLLDWLIRADKRRRAEISDCFINLCAIALSMAADALRLLWPI